MVQRIPGGRKKRLPNKKIVFRTMPSPMKPFVLEGFHWIKDWPYVYIYSSRRNEKNRCEKYDENMELLEVQYIQLEKVYRRRESDVW